MSTGSTVPLLPGESRLTRSSAPGRSGVLATFSRILVPLDGTDLAAGVLPYAKQLGTRLGAELQLLSVLPSPSEAQLAVQAPLRLLGVVYSGTTGEPNGGGESSRGHASGYLSHVAAACAQIGLAASASVRFGDPATEIVHEAREASCDLIAMTTHGRSALARGILGSVTDRVLHSAEIPVLTVRPLASPQMQLEVRDVEFPTALVIGLDGSKLAEKSIGVAAQLGKALGIPVVLVQAFDALGATSTFAVPIGVSADEVRAGMHARASHYLEKVSAPLTRSGVKVIVEPTEGIAAGALLEVAGKRPGAAILLSTRGLSGLSRWVMGSVTDKVVRAAGQPVFVLPPSVGSR